MNPDHFLFFNYNIWPLWKKKKNIILSFSDDLVMAASENVNIRTCDPDDCGPHEMCVPSKNSETNVCTCQPGYERNALNICVPNIGK